MSKLPWVYTEADELAFRSFKARTKDMPPSRERLLAEEEQRRQDELPDNHKDKIRNDFKDVMIGH